MSNLKCLKKLNCKPEVERKGCCMSSSMCLFSAPPFSHLSHLFHPIPADVWWVLWQSVHTEHYRFLTSPLKRPGPLIAQVGSMSHLGVFRLPQNEQRHVITSFKEALDTDHRHRGVRSPSTSLWVLSPESWNSVVMKQICPSRRQ